MNVQTYTQVQQNNRYCMYLLKLVQQSWLHPYYSVLLKSRHTRFRIIHDSNNAISTVMQMAQKFSSVHGVHISCPTHSMMDRFTLQQFCHCLSDTHHHR